MVEASASSTCAPSGLRVVNREVRGRSHVQFPWKLIDGPLDLALLISALLNHQLDVFIIQDPDEVTLRVAVVQGDVADLKDIPEETTTELHYPPWNSVTETSQTRSSWTAGLSVK